MLYEKLRDYSASAVPFHMPGHKRNTGLAPYLKPLGAQYDITEIGGFDDLHAPEGILLESMRRAARLWGSDETRYLVNGSTVGILASVFALSQNGGSAVIARNSHKSVYHALEITGLKPVFVLPEFDGETGAFLSLQPECIEKALDDNADIRFVMLTSPNYEGVISDVKSVCAIAHKRGIPVIVDEAHGAHLSLTEGFPGGAVRAGADVVIQSVHKTLPALTQTALLHVSGKLVDFGAICHALDIFETSSPSYLLMASADGAVRFMEGEGKAVQENLCCMLREFYAQAAKLSRIRILRPENVFLRDDSKILISASRIGVTGKEIMRILREKYAVELEAAFPGYAVAMAGTGTTRAHLERLLEALWEMDGELTGTDAPADYPAPGLPECVMSEKQALSLPWECVPCDAAAGRISAEYAWAYPPGIPIFAPGEIIDAAACESWLRILESGVRTVSTRSAPGSIAVVHGKFGKVPEK